VPVDVPGELERLMKLLRASDSAAQEQFELLKPALAGRLAADQLEKLGSALYVFDFESAAAILESLKSAGPARHAKSA
jgi:hypothetical protein